MTVTKTITTCGNQKPWMTAEVRGLLKTRDEAFRSGDKAALKTARANLCCGIKYAQKINNHFTYSRDTWSLWQAIQTIIDYKPPLQAYDDDTSLPDALNHFYSWFEMQNDTPAQKLPTPPNDQAFCLSPGDVRKTLSRINPHKAVGHDNIPGRVLKDCAEQLTDVLTDIFPTCLPSLPSSFAPFKISLCLQFRCWFVVSRRMSCVLSSLVQPCPALPVCQSVFPLQGCFCLFYLLFLIKSQFFLLQLGPRYLPITST